MHSNTSVGKTLNLKDLRGLPGVAGDLEWNASLLVKTRDCALWSWPHLCFFMAGAAARDTITNDDLTCRGGTNLPFRRAGRDHEAQRTGYTGEPARVRVAA